VTVWSARKRAGEQGRTHIEKEREKIRTDDDRPTDMQTDRHTDRHTCRYTHTQDRHKVIYNNDDVSLT
jgi:hypothetical protein